MKTNETNNVINVAIVIWEGVELLDFAGPGEVFAVAQSEDGKRFHVFTVGKSTEPVLSQGFLQVKPTFSIDDCPPADLIVLPGGGIENVTGDETLMRWIKTTIDQAEIALSVCTGAFVLASHGYLNGREATTWHDAIERLRNGYPQIRVLAGQRFVDNGTFVTSAGVSAGIDAALHLVSRLFGKQSAIQTAKYMEYDWKYGEGPAEAQPGASNGH